MDPAPLPPRRAVVAGALCVAAAPLAARAAPSLDDIIARHTRARGGTAALDRIESVLTELEIQEQGATLAARYRATRAGLMRIDVALNGQRVFSEGIDAEGAWNWAGGKPAPEPEGVAGEQALRHGIEFNLFGLHAFPARGHRLSLAGEHRIGVVTYPVIRIDMADGFTTYRYLDPETWLIARGRDFRAIHPDVDPGRKWLETLYDDYRPVEGVQSAFAQEQIDAANGRVVQRVRLTGQRFNLADAELALPRA